MTIDSRSIPASRVDTALLILRVVLGIVFLAHGYQKLFTYGFAGVTGAFTQMRIPVPSITGPFIALLEFCGGMALIVGFLTRMAALGIALDMLGALAVVHIKNGFFLPTGFEYAMSLLGVSMAVTLAGAGDLSIDSLIARRRRDVVIASTGTTIARGH